MKEKAFTQSEIGSELDMGQVIKQVIKQKGLAKSLIARKMRRKDSSILQFTKQKTMQVSIVQEFCYAMKHNLFADLAHELPKEFTCLHPQDTTKDEEITQLKRRIELLEAQVEVLRK